MTPKPDYRQVFASVFDVEVARLSDLLQSNDAGSEELQASMMTINLMLQNIVLILELSGSPDDFSYTKPFFKDGQS